MAHLQVILSSMNWRARKSWRTYVSSPRNSAAFKWAAGRGSFVKWEIDRCIVMDERGAKEGGDAQKA